MATGCATRWIADGCGSWYLYKVYIGDGGVGFAVGGDGLWQRLPTGWDRVEAYGWDLKHWPIAVSADTGGAIVATCGIRHEALITELDVFIDKLWRTMPLAVSPDQRAKSGLTAENLIGHPVVKIQSGCRILLAQGAVVWQSGPLR